MISVTFLLAAASLLLTPQSQEEWVVKGLIAATPEASDELARLWPPNALGDLDGDGRTDFAIAGDSTPPPFSGRPAWDQCYWYTGLLDRPSWQVSTGRTALFMNYQRIRLPLGTPYGWTILLDSGIRQSIELYDMQSGRQLGTVEPPPSPGSGIPPAAWYDYVYPAGDVNLDGWDDAFWVRWTNYWTYSGLIDGASLSVAWQHVETWNHGYPATPSMGEPTNLPDLDGDSISDFLFFQVIYIGSGYGYVAVALSGRNGSTIWRREGTGITTTGNVWGRDINADHIHDVILALDNDSVHALDGRTGQTIWSKDMDYLDSYFSAGYNYRFFSGSLISRSVLDGRDEITMVARYSYPLSSDEWKVAHLDSRTGAITAVVEQPTSAAPFANTGITWSSSYNYLPLGDVDRDGLMEFGVPFAAYETAPPWSTYAEQHCAILGQRTLFVPATARIGTQVQADVSIPSAGGMDCSLLLSTAFAPMGGWTVDRVETNMDPQDPVFQATNGRASLRTQLDVQGKGTILFTLPQASSLVGKDLYARALIRDPQTGKVWTVSNPSTIRITP